METTEIKPIEGEKVTCPKCMSIGSGGSRMICRNCGHDLTKPHTDPLLETLAEIVKEHNPFKRRYIDTSITNKYCKDCGHVGDPTRKKPHSGGCLLLLLLAAFVICFFFISILLSFLPLIMLLVLGRWQYAAVQEVCSLCGKNNIIPVNSPTAKALRQKG